MDKDRKEEHKKYLQKIKTEITHILATGKPIVCTGGLVVMRNIMLLMNGSCTLELAEKFKTSKIPYISFVLGQPIKLIAIRHPKEDPLGVSNVDRRHVGRGEEVRLARNRVTRSAKGRSAPA